jgi:hypothetical protein
MTNGTFYNFVPAKDGALYVAVKLNPNKTHFVTEGGAQLLTSQTTEEPVFGEISFNVAAGKQYQVFSSGSKMGFFGFRFLAGETVEEPLIPTGINTVSTASANTGVIYNLNGQQMNGTLKSGLYIVNGKKVLVK